MTLIYAVLLFGIFTLFSWIFKVAVAPAYEKMYVVGFVILFGILAYFAHHTLHTMLAFGIGAKKFTAEFRLVVKTMLPVILAEICVLAAVYGLYALVFHLLPRNSVTVVFEVLVLFVMAVSNAVKRASVVLNHKV